MRATVTTIVAVATLALMAEPAPAKWFNLKGTFSVDTVQKDCASVKGEFRSNSKGFGCYNPNNGTSVGCKPNGHCEGVVPGRLAPGNSGKPALNSIDGILLSSDIGSNKAAKSGNPIIGGASIGVGTVLTGPLGGSTGPTYPRPPKTPPSGSAHLGTGVGAPIPLQKSCLDPKKCH
jgi:hypothetical protein